jgi:hypothetical protein
MSAVQPILSNNISFGYSHKLKTDFKKGKLKIKYDMAGNELTKENVSLDHVIPKSQGGSSTLDNYVLATKEFNSFRGVVPLSLLITKEMFEKWAKQFDNLIVCGVKGKDYVKMIAKKIWG